MAAGLVFVGGRVLVAQRLAGGHLGGLWEFPGGKLEVGESFEGCLVREVREELGLVVVVGSLVAGVEYDYPEVRVRIRFYRCGLVGGVARAIGCADFRWVGRGELGGYDFAPADGVVLERLGRDGGLWV